MSLVGGGPAGSCPGEEVCATRAGQKPGSPQQRLCPRLSTLCPDQELGAARWRPAQSQVCFPWPPGCHLPSSPSGSKRGGLGAQWLSDCPLEWPSCLSCRGLRG